MKTARRQQGLERLALLLALACAGLVTAAAGAAARSEHYWEGSDTTGGAPGAEVTGGAAARSKNGGAAVPPEPAASPRAAARRLAAAAGPGPVPGTEPCPAPLVAGATLTVVRPCAVSLPPRLARPGASVVGVPNAEHRLPWVVAPAAGGGAGGAPARMAVEPGARPP
jgi:hypothetical protein